MQAQHGTIKDGFLQVLTVVLKCLKTAVIGTSWPFWSCPFLPAAWPLCCLLQCQHHLTGRIPSRSHSVPASLLLPSTRAAWNFPVSPGKSRVLGILPIRLSPNRTLVSFHFGSSNIIRLEDEVVYPYSSLSLVQFYQNIRSKAPEVYLYLCFSCVQPKKIL